MNQTLAPNETLHGFSSAIKPLEPKQVRAVAKRAAVNFTPSFKTDNPQQVRKGGLAADTPSMMEVTSNTSKSKCKKVESSHYLSNGNSNNN